MGRVGQAGPAEGALPIAGRFVVLEGIDGCGKTTQLEALADWLPGSGLLPPGSEPVRTREPGGTELGQALRQLLLHPPPNQEPCHQAELLLYAADRAQHLARVIRPALAAGHWVLSDRFTGSTAAYQGYGRGLSLDLIDRLELIATEGIQPDLTLWLDLPLELSQQRRRQRQEDRLEAAGAPFLQRVADGFQQLARQRCWQRIDAAADPAQVGEAIRQAVRKHFSSAAAPVGSPAADA